MNPEATGFSARPAPQPTSQTNSFSASWSLPSDSGSPITEARYQICQNGNCSTPQAAPSLTSVSGLTLPAAASAQQLLDCGTPLSAGAAAAGARLDQTGLAALRELHLLTAKPFLYVFNMDVSELGDEDLRKRLADLVAPAEAVFLDAKTEADLAELPEDEAAELLAEAGMGEPGLAQLARAGFRALGLQTFLTAGPKETRAWEIRAGATAPEAAGVIHSDFQRGFIKAEVVSYEDLIAAGSLPAARAAGKARI